MLYTFIALSLLQTAHHSKIAQNVYFFTIIASSHSIKVVLYRESFIVKYWLIIQ